MLTFWAKAVRKIESDQPWKWSWRRSLCCWLFSPLPEAPSLLFCPSQPPPPPPGKPIPCPAAFLELREEKFVSDLISRKSDARFDKNNQKLTPWWICLASCHIHLCAFSSMFYLFPHLKYMQRNCLQGGESSRLTAGQMCIFTWGTAQVWAWLLLWAVVIQKFCPAAAQIAFSLPSREDFSCLVIHLHLWLNGPAWDSCGNRTRV